MQLKKVSILQDRQPKLVATIRKFYEVFTTRVVSEFDQILANDWQPLPIVPVNPGGRDGQKGTEAYLRSVLSGLVYSVEEIRECGPEVVLCR